MFPFSSVWSGLNSRKRKNLPTAKKARASVAAGDCYIFGSAEGISEKLEIKEEDLVIFCDGGLKYADRVQKKKCFLFGDLDSCEEEMLRGLCEAYEKSRTENPANKTDNSDGEKGCRPKETEVIQNYFECLKNDTDSELEYAGKKLTVRLFPVRKDDTDTALALKFALKKNCKRFFLYGCCGGDRPDHFFANLALLSLAAEHGKQAFLYDGRYCYTMIGNGAGSAETVIEGSAGKRYSCFAYGGNVTGLRLSGFEYETEDITLLKDVSLGAGNTIKSDRAGISIRTGQLLIVSETEPVSFLSETKKG